MSNVKLVLGVLLTVSLIYHAVFAQPVTRVRPWREETRCMKAADLNLSSDQMKNLDLINQTYARETRVLRNEMFSKRMELRELLTNPNVKVETIQLKNSELVEVRSKLDERAIEYLVKLRSLLTQEQLRRWCPEQEFPSMAGMMSRPEGPPMMPRRISPQYKAKEE